MTSLSPSPDEIVAAFRFYAARPRQDQIDALRAKGVGPWAMAGAPGTGEHEIRFTQIEIDRSGRFEFRNDGEHAMAVVVLDAWSEPADIVAWTKGGRIAAWLGAAAVIGTQHVTGPRLDAELTVYPDPLSWLRSDRIGVVLVDPPRAARELRDFGPFLAAGGFEHASRLVALLTPPPPRVMVPKPGIERRAA